MFLIRDNAFNILVDIYKNCDSNLRVTRFDCKKYNDDIGDFIKSIKYLQESGYIAKTNGLTPDSVEITVKGIDKAEDIILLQQEEQQ